MDWIRVTQETDQWQSLEHSNESPGFIKCCDFFSRVAEQLLASEEGISVELVTEVMKVHSSLLPNALDPLFLHECAKFSDHVK
jgi:hypothetical protein